MGCFFAEHPSLLASSGYEHDVRLWDAATGKPLASLKGHDILVWTVAWSPDGRLASGSGDRTVRVWWVG